MVQDALSRIEDPAHISCTGSAGETPSVCCRQRVPECPQFNLISPGTGWPWQGVVLCLSPVSSCLQITSCPGRLQPLSALRGCRMHTANTLLTAQVRQGSTCKTQGNRPWLGPTAKALWSPEGSWESKCRSQKGSWATSAEPRTLCACRRERPAALRGTLCPPHQ